MPSEKLVFLCRTAEERASVLIHLQQDPDCTSLTLNHVRSETALMPVARGPHLAESIVQARLQGEIDLDTVASISGCRDIYSVETRQYIEPPPAKDRSRLLKRMSCLVRHARVGTGEFRKIWAEEHGWKVAQASSDLLGYRQHGVLRSAVGALACDGFTELWFGSLEAMNLLLPQTRWSPLSVSADTFIGAITPFLLLEEILK